MDLRMTGKTDNISFVAVNPRPVRTARWSGLVAAMARDMKLPFNRNP